jgi:hypothetical protein
VYQYESKTAGPLPITTVNMEVPTSKTNKGGDKDVRQIPRHCDVFRCSQHHLAQAVYDVVHVRKIDLSELIAGSPNSWLLWNGAPLRTPATQYLAHSVCMQLCGTKMHAAACVHWQQQWGALLPVRCAAHLHTSRHMDSTDDENCS